LAEGFVEPIKGIRTCGKQGNILSRYLVGDEIMHRMGDIEIGMLDESPQKALSELKKGA
jgi:hypothetical protein